MANQSRFATLGSVACLLLAVSVFAPALIITEQNVGVAAYYAAGPIGLSVVGFLSLLGVVVFLAGGQERTDPATVAGLGVVLGVAMLAFTLLWAVSLDATTIFSFPAEYSWIANHRWAVTGLALAVLVVAGGYAQAVLR
jgi:hypothetical protein